MGSLARFVAWMILAVCFCIQYSNGERCPPPSWIKPTRICISNKECYPGLCCPDYQGRKSCALPQTGHGPSKTGDLPAVNCDGVKCRPYEVCKLDPITKRRRCVRA